MYETLRIVAKLKPKYVIWENVKNLLSKKHRHNFDKYLDRMTELGYQNFYQVLNAKDYGIPQNRERVFTISILGGGEFKFPEKQELKLRLKDMLEENVDEKYYLSDKMINFFYKNEQEQKEKGNGFRFGVSDGNVIAKSVTTRAGGRMDDNFIKQVGTLDIKGQDSIKRVYASSGLSPTLTDMQGGNRQPKVLVKNATKQGYDIVTDGDSINLQYPESKTRRGRVGNQVAQTLQCNDSMGVVTAVAQSGREEGQQLEISDREYANSITTVQKDSMVCIGDNQKIRKDTKTMEKYCEYCGNKLERKRFNGVLEDFTVFKNRKYCNRECMKRAYLKIGENKQTYSNAHATARKINELILHKECCEVCGSTHNLDIHHIDGNWKNNSLDNLMCLCRSCHMKYELNKDKFGGDEPMNDRLRIRKLTPKECWRL